MRVIDSAIDKEIDSEAFYKNLAAQNQSNNSGMVFRLFSKAEQLHADYIRKKRTSYDTPLPERTCYLELLNVLKNIRDNKSEILSDRLQLETYRSALQHEQKSIEFYTALTETVEDHHEKDLLRHLADEEKFHFELLNWVLMMLLHAEE